MAVFMGGREEKMMASERERDPELGTRGLKLIGLVATFGVPLAVLDYFFVSKHPWLYLLYVLLLGAFFWCVSRVVKSR